MIPIIRDTSCMNRSSKIIISGIFLLVVSLVVHRFWIQYCPVRVVVGVQRLLSPQDQVTIARFSRDNTTAFSSTYEDGIPYDTAPDKKITRSELARLRRIAAWSFWRSYPIELIVIHNASNVTAHVKDSAVSSLYFTNRDGRWNCEIRRGHVDRLEGTRRVKSPFSANEMTR